MAVLEFTANQVAQAISQGGLAGKGLFDAAGYSLANQTPDSSVVEAMTTALNAAAQGIGSAVGIG